MMKRLALALALVLAGCASAPTSLSPNGQLTYQANQAVIAIGTVQHAAIELNKVQVCTPAPVICHPFLSDANTGIVVDAVANALTVIRQVPSGWKAASLTAIMTMRIRLDQAGQGALAAYLTAATTVVNALL